MRAAGPPIAMTVSASDPGGATGIQADLKTFAALGVYGASALTAITAQRPLGVTETFEMPLEMVRAQIDAMMADVGADAVKTGMLPSTSIIEAVAEKVKEHRLSNLVVDPEIVARSGDRLLPEDAVDAVRTLLVPLATVVTPNVPEAGALVGREVTTVDDAREAAREIVAMGAQAVVVTGGRLDGPATDVLLDGGELRAYTVPRISTTTVLGTGCTFASAIAAGLARGLSVRDAVSQAKKYVTDALRHAVPMGPGHGALDHFYAMRQSGDDSL